MENEITCPKCKGHSIVQGTKGYSLGKAAVGGFILGPVGLLAGTHKSKDIRFTCLDCGHKFTVDDIVRMKEAEIPVHHTPIELHDYQTDLTSEEREEIRLTNEQRTRKWKIRRVVFIILIVCFTATIFLLGIKD